MSSLLRPWLTHQGLGLLCVLAMLLGLFFSRGLLSVGMIGLTVNAVFNRQLMNHLRTLRQQPQLWCLIGVFLLYLVSGLNSEDHSWWLDRVRMKLPFLLLPLAVLSIPRFGRRWFEGLHLFLFGLLLLLCLYSLLGYALDYEAITRRYSAGQIMPTPIQHIRFSLLVAYGVATGWYLRHTRLLPSWGRYIMLGGAVFMLVYLHLLAVRSGLLALYVWLAYFMVSEIWRHRRTVLGLGVVFFVAASLLMAYFLLPTLKHKVDYTIYSLEQLQRGESIAVLSDSYRIGSIQAGLAIGRDYPVFGVGVGDIKAACDAYYAQYYPDLENRGTMPHNQYLFVLASAGIVGLLFFLVCILYPWWHAGGLRNGLLSAFHLILLSSFVVEHTLETQIGTALYLVPLLLHLRYYIHQRSEEYDPAIGSRYHLQRSR